MKTRTKGCLLGVLCVAIIVVVFVSHQAARKPARLQAPALPLSYDTREAGSGNDGALRLSGTMTPPRAAGAIRRSS